MIDGLESREESKSSGLVETVEEIVDSDKPATWVAPGVIVDGWVEWDSPEGPVKWKVVDGKVEWRTGDKVTYIEVQKLKEDGPLLM